MSSFQPLDPDQVIDPFNTACLTGLEARTGLYLDTDANNSSVLIQTNNTNAVYVDKFQNMGINTVSPAAQLDVNSASNSHIQLTYNSSSVNKARIGVTSDGKLVLTAGGSEVNVDALSNFNIKSHNGTTAGLMLGNSLVNATADQLNFNVVTPGTASVSKALILDSNGSIAGITSLSASQLEGTLQTSYQPNVTSVDTLNVTTHNGAVGLSLGGVLVSATAAELNYVDVMQGSAAASKALIVDASRNIDNINMLTASNVTGTLLTAAQPNITSLGTLTGLAFNGSLTGLTDLSINTTEGGRTLVVNSETGTCIRMYYDSASTVANYADMLVDSAGNLNIMASGGNVDISTHDGVAQGLQLGGIMVTASADQINYLQGTTPGNTVGGKALIVDTNRNLGNLGQVTMEQMYGTVLTPAQPNINAVNQLNISTHNGVDMGLKLNGTLVTAAATELNYVDTTPGTVEATKAVVVDASKSIVGFNSVSATEFVGLLATTAQPNVTSVGVLTSIETSGDLTMGVTAISESEIKVLDGAVPGTATALKAMVVDADVNIAGINTLTATNFVGTLQTQSQPNLKTVETLNVSNANGTTAGLELAGVLVTATATELNYVDTIPGAAAGTKALVLDNNKDISGVHVFTADEVVGTLMTPSQPNITSVGVLQSLAVGGDVTVGSTVLSETELAVVDAVTPGLATASKALVIDSNKDIGTIRNLYAEHIVSTDVIGTIITAAQPSITSVSTLDITAHDGTTQGLRLGGVLLTATANQINSIFGAGGTGTFTDLAVNHNLTIPYADGMTQGLILGSTLMTASGDELNYLDGSIPGTVVASKALVVDEFKDLSALRNLTAATVTGTIMTQSQPNVTSVGVLDSLAVAGTVTVGDTILNEAEVSVLDAVVPGTADASKALILDANKNIGGIHDLSANTLTATDGSLTMGATVLGETEVAVLDAVTPGTVAANKAVVVDSNKDIAAFRTLTAANLIATNGSLTMGVTDINEAEIAVLDTAIPGSASALKAVVLDANKDFSGVRILSADALTSTDGSLTMGATVLNEAEVAVLDSVVLGEASPSKALVVDSAMDISGIHALSANSLTSTDGSLTMGTTDLNESEMKVLDGVVPGVVQPLRAAVVDGNKDISSFRNLTSVTLTSTSGSLTMGGTNISESDIAVVDAVTPGAAAPFKALVLDEASDISGIHALSADTLTSVDGTLVMGATTLIEDEVKVLDTVVPGTASPSKALVVDASKDISDIHALSASSLTATSGSLTMGATALNEAEVAVLDAVTPGLVSASKAVVVDENKDISSFRNLTAVNVTGTLQTADQPNVTSVGALDSLAVVGDITIGSTVVTEANAIELVNATPGTATSTHVMITDTVNSIAGINTLTAGGLVANTLTGTISTPAQPYISSVNALDVTTHDGTTVGLKLGGVLLRATAPQLNAIVDGSSTIAFADVSIANDLVLAGHDGSTNGLILGETLVTATGDELNYNDTTPGHAQALKSLVFDANVDIDSIHHLTALNLSGTILTTAQPNIETVTTLDITAHDGSTQGLKLGGVLLTATAAQINSIFGAGGEGTFNNLTVMDTLTIANADGSSMGIVLGETLLTASGTELNYLDGSTPGTATASNALVLDSLSNITGINSLTASAFTGVLQTAAQPNVTSVGTLSSLAIAGNLTMGTTVLSEAEVHVLDAVVPGTVAASKAVVVDENKDISSFNNLTAINLYGQISTPAQPLITSVGALDGLYVVGDVNVGGTLTVGGTIISESEIVALDAAVPGTATANKAMVTDAMNDISNIHFIGASQISGELVTSDQPNVTSVGALVSLAVIGDVNVGGTLTVGGTIISESEIVALDAAVPGTATANKAMVTDGTNSIAGINSLSATQLIGEIQTTSQPNIESVVKLDITSHDGALTGLKLGGTLVTSTASELNYVDTTVGTAQPSKALVVDETKDISGIHNMSMTALTSETGAFTDVTQSTSPETGAITTAGGVGIAKNLSVGGDIILTGVESIVNSTDTSSVSTGSIVTAGGVGIAKSLYVGANTTVVGNMNVSGTTSQAGVVTVTNSTDSTAAANGAIIVTGGVGVGKNLSVGANASVAGTFAVSGTTALTGAASILSTTDSTSAATGSLVTSGGVGIAKNLSVGVNATVGGTLTITGNTTHVGTEIISNTTDSTSVATGSLTTAGGVGIAKNLNVGGSAATGALTVTGNAGVSGTATIGTLGVTGNSAVSGASTVTGSMTAGSVAVTSPGGVAFSTSIITNVTNVPYTSGTRYWPILAYCPTNNSLISASSWQPTVTYSTNESTWTDIPFTSGLPAVLTNGLVRAVQVNPVTGTIWAAIAATNTSTYKSTGCLVKGTTAGFTTVYTLASNLNVPFPYDPIAMPSLAVASDTSIIVSANSTIYYTTDGSTFQAAAFSGGTPLNVAWNATINKFHCMVTSPSGATSLFYSSTGATWAACTTPSNASPNMGVVYNTAIGKAVAVGDNFVWYSSDGITWTACTGIPSGLGVIINSPVAALICIYIKLSTLCMYSTNGINWTSATATSAFGYFPTANTTCAVNTSTYYAYALTSSGTVQKIGPVNYSSTMFGLSVTSGYLQNKSNTGYQWYSGSTSSAIGTKLLQLDSTLSVSVAEAITDTTESSSITTGSLVTAGGVGIAKNLSVGGTLSIEGGFSQNGVLNVANTTDSTSTSTGAIVTAGGVGIAKNLNVGANATVAGTFAATGDATFAGIESITNATDATSTSSGSFFTAGGAGVGKSLFVGTSASVGGSIAVGGSSTLTGAVSIADVTPSTSSSTGSLTTAGGAGVGLDLNVGGSASIGGSAVIAGSLTQGGVVSVTDTTESTSYLNGSIKTAGGVGIAKNLNVNGVTTITNASPSTSTDTGALVVSGGVGITLDMHIGGDVTIAGDTAVVGDLTMDGKINATYVGFRPDAASPFTTSTLTTISTTTSLLSLNYHAGVGHVNSASSLVCVPSLITNSSVVYYAPDGTSNWATLGLTGAALTKMQTEHAEDIMIINQIMVNAWSNVIWLAGAIKNTTTGTSTAIVLSGNLDDGIDTIYEVGSPSVSSATIACTQLAAATDDMNVVAIRYIATGQADLYCMDLSESPTFAPVATGSFVSVAWLQGLGKFVAGRTDTSSIYTSTTSIGDVWVGSTTPTGVAPNSICYNSTLNLAVAVGPDFLWYSTNGTTWTNCTYTEIAAGNKYNAVMNSPVSGIVAVYSSAADSLKQMHYTIDAINWTSVLITETFGYTTPLNSTVALDQANYAYTLSYTGLASIVQKVGPINSASAIYHMDIDEGYLTTSAAFGHQWWSNTTETDYGNKLMELSTADMQVIPVVRIKNTTNAVSTASGSFTTSGGVGIAKNLFVGQDVTIGGGLNMTGDMAQSGLFAVTDTTESVSTTTGAIVTAGGIGVSKSISVGINATVGGALAVSGVSSFDGSVSIASTANSISASSGSIVTAGGVGIAKSLNVGTNAAVGGDLSISGAAAVAGLITSTNDTDTSSSTTGAVTTLGGMGIGKSLVVGAGVSVGGNISVIGTSTTTGAVLVNASEDATSALIGGAFSVVGGAGIAKSLFVGQNASIGAGLTVAGALSTGDVTLTSATDSSSVSTGSIVTPGGVGISKALNVGTSVTIGETLSAAGQVTLTSVTNASSPATGALTVSGGAGIAKSLYVGDGIYGTIQTPDQPNITTVGTLDILLADGFTAGLRLGGSLVTSSATELNYLNGSLPGAAAPGTALVLNGNSDISGINALSAIELNGTIQTASQPLITSVTSLDITGADGSTTGLRLAGVLLTASASQLNDIVNGTSSTLFANATITNNLTLSGADGATTGLILGSTLVTATATELNYVDTTVGTAEPLKALVLNANSDIAGINSLSAVQLTGTIQTASQPLITSVTTLDITGANGSDAGLKLGGDLVTATAIELNYVDTTPGTAAPFKALVLDSNSSIAGITSVSATSFVGTLSTANQPNVTQVGTLLSLAVAGDLTMGTTVISEIDIAKIDNITNGAASADKALVLDSNKSIAGITSLGSDKLAVGAPASTNLPLEVGTVQYQFSGAYAYANSQNAHGTIDAGLGMMASYSGRFDGRVLVTGELQITSDKRLKKNIDSLSPELSKKFIMTTTPVKFNWKSEDSITDYGYIAQDVLKAGFSDLVTVAPHPGMIGSVEEDGFINPEDAKYVFSPGKIIPMLALNQRDVFEQLEAKDAQIANLEARLSTLEKLFEKLA